ncbi:MAG: superoxide dismutase [Parcubacteria group bacterium CG11_big_fil_rev_8_21_14_0_20_39_22]|nr:MAG: superoxide dismutase [Parcubacteria group bacterium CG11_big_fil_rev_8_21_14_0_20_39_22]
MKKFEEIKFSIPELKGISQKTNEEHLKLYSGYVKHANLILEHIDDLSEDTEKNTYEIAELQRRFGFEFDGMRNHEYYFHGFEGGSKEIDDDSELKKAIEEEWGSFEDWINRFKSIAKTRGVGWAILYYDPHSKRLLNAWIDEQHLGHLTGLSPILALDMWEHSFVADYQPSGKGKYIDDFFENLNWSVIERNYTDARIV